MNHSMRGKTVFITGSSRGIGRAIARRVAEDGAQVVITGKTITPDPRLPGTIHDAAAEVEAVGGRALACRMDVRDADQITAAVRQAVDHFGGIDIVVNNASALFLADTPATPVKRFDLIHSVNVRATFLTTQACLPFLERAESPHVLNIAPPLHLESRWFAPHVAYSLSKFGMSLCVLGMAEEFRDRRIAVNALWPRTAIATAAVQNLLGGDATIRRCRHPQIMADAAHWILTQSSETLSGQFLIDEDVLRRNGMTDFTPYAVDPTTEPLPDFFV